MIETSSQTRARIWATLDLWHRGRDQAVTKDALAAALGLDERVLRRNIEYLRDHEHRPIGSTPGGRRGTAGYFVMQDVMDIRVGMGSRWRAAVKTIHTLRQQAVGIAGMVNLEMEFGELNPGGGRGVIS